jgi:imidazolonepropionase-like amidohydrolase
VVACCGVSLTAVGQEVLAIKGGRILPIVGDPIDGGVILIRNGRIAAVGKEVEIPVEAKVLDATGKVVMPGFVEPHSSGAMSQSNEVNPNVPFLSVVDTIDPSLEYFEEARRNGVTTVAVVPGNATMIGGQAAVIKTAGTYVDEMLLKRHAGMKISLSPSGSSSRMSHYARLRRELQRARDYLDGVADSAAASESASTSAEKSETPDSEQQQQPGSESNQQPTPDPAQNNEAQRAAMAKLLKGEFPAFMYCATGMDVLQAIRLTETYT